MSDYSIVILPRKGVTLSEEMKQEIEKDLRNKYGSDCTIEFLSKNNCSVGDYEQLSAQIQDPEECTNCFMSGEPLFPTCRRYFIDSIDADNTCILWRCRDYCPDFTPKTDKK